MSKQPLVDQLDIAVSQIIGDPDVQLASLDAAVMDLVGIARDLGNLPRPDFKAQLREELQRRITMSTKTAVFRPDFRTVTPYLLAPNAELVDFLKNVFGAVQTERTDTSPTSFHAELRIGDSMLMVGVGSGRSMPLALQVYVPDVDTVYDRALAAGAKTLNPIIEDHGDRFGCVEDPGGNHWYISKRLGPHYVPEGQHSLTVWFHPTGSAKFIDFVKQAFGGRELERYDSPEGRVVHAKIGIGDSVIALSEPHDWWQPMTSMMYLYVPNVDELYQQALRSGATSISAPTDHSYGDRSAGVQDEWGNMWYMATPI